MYTSKLELVDIKARFSTRSDVGAALTRQCFFFFHAISAAHFDTVVGSASPKVHSGQHKRGRGPDSRDQHQPLRGVREQANFGPGSAARSDRHLDPLGTRQDQPVARQHHLPVADRARSERQLPGCAGTRTSTRASASARTCLFVVEGVLAARRGGVPQR